MNEQSKKEHADLKEARFNARVEKLEQNEKKKKRIVTAVVCALIAIFLGGMVWGIRSVVSAEGTGAPIDTSPQPCANLFVSPASSDGELLCYFTGNRTLLPEDSPLAQTTSLLDTLRENEHKARLTITSHIDLTDFSVDGSTQGALVELFNSKKGDILASLYKMYTRRDGLADNVPDYEGAYGTDFMEQLPEASFTSPTAILSEGRYDADAAAYTELDKRYLTFAFAVQDFDALTPQSELFSAFRLAEDAELPALLREKYSDVFIVDKLSIVCDGFRIEACAQRENDALEYIHYLRQYRVEATVTFTGAYAALGTQHVAFTFHDTLEYAFTWAQLKLSLSSLSLEKGKSDDVQAIAEPLDAQVHWELRGGEQTIVTLEDGNTSLLTEEKPTDIIGHTCYVKGEKNSTEPVVLVAYFELLGERYEASCEVFVRKPAESVVVAEKKEGITLGLQQSVQLHGSVKPAHDFLSFGDGATEKSVLWFSEDTEIASVNADGLVNAVSAGATNIIALSKDGYYKASVPVLVEAGDLALSEYLHEMAIGDSFTLTLDDGHPEGLWYCGDETVAQVKDGTVVAQHPGTTRVYYTVKDADGTVTETVSCLLTVTQRSEVLSVGDTLPLPSFTEIGDAVQTGWFTTNGDVAAVDAEGVLAAQKTGTANIYAGFSDGSFVPYAAVTVQ